jgi:hypothetical protein
MFFKACNLKPSGAFLENLFLTFFYFGMRKTDFVSRELYLRAPTSRSPKTYSKRHVGTTSAKNVIA